MKLHSLHLLPLLAFGAQAQANTGTTELEYRSAFEGYRAYAEPEIQNWPDMIKRVEEIGGWRAYAREATAQPADSKPADSKGTSTHRHDQQHGGAK